MKISFQVPYNHSSEKFQYWTILPTIEFVIDRQMEKTLYGDGFEPIGGVVEYSIGLMWLKFAFWMNIEVPAKQSTP